MPPNLPVASPTPMPEPSTIWQDASGKFYYVLVVGQKSFQAVPVKLGADGRVTGDGIVFEVQALAEDWVPWDGSRATKATPAVVKPTPEELPTAWTQILRDPSYLPRARHALA